MDPTVVNQRLNDLDNVLKYVNKTEGDIIITLQSMGWSKNGITKVVPLVNKSRMTHSSRRERHSTQHQFKDVRYKSDAHFLPDTPERATSDSFMTDSMVHIGTREERLALYDSTVAAHSSSSNDFPLPSTQGKQSEIDGSMPKTYLEELALIRDLKRRRSKYKVSTKSKTYTEIMREVIINQMDLYKDYIKGEEDKVVKKKLRVESNASSHCDNKRRRRDNNYEDRQSKRNSSL